MHEFSFEMIREIALAIRLFWRAVDEDALVSGWFHLFSNTYPRMFNINGQACQKNIKTTSYWPEGEDDSNFDCSRSADQQSVAAWQIWQSGIYETAVKRLNLSLDLEKLGNWQTRSIPVWEGMLRNFMSLGKAKGLTLEMARWIWCLMYSYFGDDDAFFWWEGWGDVSRAIHTSSIRSDLPFTICKKNSRVFRRLFCVFYVVFPIDVSVFLEIGCGCQNPVLEQLAAHRYFGCWVSTNVWNWV